MRVLIQSFLFVYLLFTWTCTTPPEYPIEPVIEFIAFEKDTLNQGESKNVDFVYLILSFTDGDGDLGPEEGVEDTIKSIVMTDTRTGVSENQFDLPEISDKGASNGISGEITIKVPTTCCIFPPEITDVSGPCDDSQEYPVDQVEWEIYLVDRAGNESNKLILPPMNLRCN